MKTRLDVIRYQLLVIGLGKFKSKLYLIYAGSIRWGMGLKPITINI